MQVYLHSFSRGCLPNMLTGAKFRENLNLQGSRSSKVDDFSTNRKRIYDFLLVINSNGPILHCFWDTATYLLKIAYFSYPFLIRRPRSLCSLWNFAVKLSVRKLVMHGGTLWWRLRDPNFNRLWLTHPCDGQTDRQTDGTAIAYAYSALYRMLSRAKNHDVMWLWLRTFLARTAWRSCVGRP